MRRVTIASIHGAFLAMPRPPRWCAAEVFAVTSGCHVKSTLKSTAHQLCAPKSTCEGNLFLGLGRLLQFATSSFNAHLLDVTGGSGLKLACENSAEVSRAHRNLCGKDFDREGVLQVLQNPHLKFLKGPVCSDLGAERRTELRLTSRTPQKQNQSAGSLQRNGTAEILLHKRQDEIHAGRNPCGGVDRAILYPDWIRLDFGVRVKGGKILTMSPVRCGPFALKQIGCGEQKCACADGDNTAGLRGHCAHPTDNGRPPFRSRADSSRNQQCVDGTLNAAIMPMRQDRKTGLPRNEPARLGRNHLDLVGRALKTAGTIDSAENFYGADDIEFFHRRDRENDNPSWPARVPLRACCGFGMLSFHRQ